MNNMASCKNVDTFPLKLILQSGPKWYIQNASMAHSSCTGWRWLFLRFVFCPLWTADGGRRVDWLTTSHDTSLAHHTIHFTCLFVYLKIWHSSFRSTTPKTLFFYISSIRDSVCSSIKSWKWQETQWCDTWAATWSSSWWHLLWWICDWHNYRFCFVSIFGNWSWRNDHQRHFQTTDIPSRKHLTQLWIPLTPETHTLNPLTLYTERWTSGTGQ